jgi:hypothetical protein
MYQYRGYAGDSLVFEATCVIPATENAARRMDRIFRVQRSPEKTLSLMSEEDPCGKAGCLLNPITVTACVGGNTYPNCDEKPEDHDQCYDFGICGGDSGTGWTGGGGGGGGGGDPTVAPDEGPVLFAVCVLAMIGSLAAFDIVASSFTEWYAAWKDFTSAQRMLDAIEANNDAVDPAVREVWILRRDIAKTRMDGAVGTIHTATGASILTLGAASLACGMGMTMPTP